VPAAEVSNQKRWKRLVSWAGHSYDRDRPRSIFQNGEDTPLPPRMQTKQPIPGLTAATCLRNAESKNECGFTWMEDCMSLYWGWICLVDTYTFHKYCIYIYTYIFESESHR
jgi:hypothetical protein